MPPLDSACAPEIGARPTGRRKPIDPQILRDKSWKGRSRAGESPADSFERPWIETGFIVERGNLGRRGVHALIQVGVEPPVLRPRDRRPIAAASLQREESIRFAARRARSGRSAVHGMLLEGAALDGSSDRSALSWTRFSLNSTSPWADEGRFRDFDLANAIQNPGVARIWPAEQRHQRQTRAIPGLGGPSSRRMRTSGAVRRRRRPPSQGPYRAQAMRFPVLRRSGVAARQLEASWEGPGHALELGVARTRR